ncbi:hypothetical protein EGJ15_08370 [Pseudomonas sp. p99-361]|nr:hypothetical protein FPB55_10805 [Pseudomonas sp. BJP69]RRV72853.1 hypothetical protein EGJ15_08370 [Pseudomonas sp. p99-361]
MVRHGQSRLVVLSPCREPHRPVRRRGCGDRIGSSARHAQIKCWNTQDSIAECAFARRGC